MDLKEIKALAKLMQSLGIISYKTPELELVVQPAVPKQRRRRSKSSITEEPILTGNGFKGYTDEEILAWSSAPVAGEEDAQS